MNYAEKLQAVADEAYTAAQMEVEQPALKALAQGVYLGLRKAQEILEDAPLMLAKPELGTRSPHWPTFRAHWIKDHPTCAACGAKEDCDVHHVKVFHLFPELELDPTNFLTLCTPHHLWYGHLGDWKSWNETVVHDAALFLFKVKNRPYPKLIKQLQPSPYPLEDYS